MLTWLSANLINFIIAGLLILVVALAIRGMIRDKRAGKSCCGGSCASCGVCSGGCPGSCAASGTKQKQSAVPPASRDIQ